MGCCSTNSASTGLKVRADGEFDIRAIDAGTLEAVEQIGREVQASGRRGNGPVGRIGPEAKVVW